MLRLPPFELRRPASVAEAAEILAGEGANEGQARLVAGGTDLWPNMKRRHQKARVVVSLNAVPGLAGIHGANGDGARIGAMTTLTALLRHREIVERYPALATAVAGISAPVLRNMGTLGGNLCLDTRCTYYNQNEEWRRSIDYCMKEEGTVCWVAPGSPRCWAISASDSAPMLSALGARVRLVSAAGERTVPVADLYRDDGIDYLAKRPDEIVTEVLLPAESDAGNVGSGYAKLRRRGSIDYAVLTAGAALWFDGGPERAAEGAVVTHAELYLGAVASFPTPAPEAAAALVGKPISEETMAVAAKLARKVATPLDNTDFQAQWRGAMVERYTAAALKKAAGRPIDMNLT